MKSISDCQLAKLGWEEFTASAFLLHATGRSKSFAVSTHFVQLSLVPTKSSRTHFCWMDNLNCVQYFMNTPLIQNREPEYVNRSFFILLQESKIKSGKKVEGWRDFASFHLVRVRVKVSSRFKLLCCNAPVPPSCLAIPFFRFQRSNPLFVFVFVFVFDIFVFHFASFQNTTPWLICIPSNRDEYTQYTQLWFGFAVSYNPRICSYFLN